MSKVLRFPVPAKADESFSYIRAEDFAPEYEAEVRMQTAGMATTHTLPQDKLLYVFATINPHTGAAFEFGWHSGRRDVRATIDMSFEALVMSHSHEQVCAMLEQRNELINTLKEKYNATGFSHSDYVGGFEEFAQNFERVTGRQLPSAFAELCRGKRSASA